MLPIGHTAPVIFAQFTLDNKHIFTTALDNTIKLWELNSGKLLYSVDRGQVGKFKFSKDGSKIIASSNGGIVKIWELKSGQLIKTLDIADSRLPCTYGVDMSDKLVLSYNESCNYEELRDITRDGNYLDQDDLKIWDSRSGKKIKTIKMWRPLPPLTYDSLFGQQYVNSRDAFFSKDGTYIVVISNLDSLFKIYDIAGGKIILERKELYGIDQALVSNDFNYIVTLSSKGALTQWDLKTGKLVSRFSDSLHACWASFSPDSKNLIIMRAKDSPDRFKPGDDSRSQLCILQDGKLRFTIENVLRFLNPAISNDSRLVLINTSSSIKAYSLDNGSLTSEFVKTTGVMSDIAFSPDDKHIIATNQDKAIVWSVTDKTPQIQLKGGALQITNIAFKQSSDYLFINEFVPANNFTNAPNLPDINQATVWDLPKGHLIKSLNTGKSSEVISNDGKKLFLPKNNSINAISLANDEVIYQLKQDNDKIQKLIASKNGQFLLSLSSDTSIAIWNIRENILVKKWKFPYTHYRVSFLDSAGNYILIGSQGLFNNTYKFYDWSADKIAFQFSVGSTSSMNTGYMVPIPDYIFSSNARYVYINKDISRAGPELWDVMNNKKLRDYAYMWASAIAINQNETKLAISRWDSLIIQSIKDSITLKKYPLFEIIDAQTLKKHSAFEMNDEIETRSPPASMFFTDDDKYLLLTYANGNIRMVSLENDNEKVKEFSGHSNYILKIRFTSDNKYMVSASADRTCKVWDISNGTCLYSFFKIDSLNYLVYDSKGRFDGTEAARKLLYFTCGTEIIELDQLKDQLWVPNLAERIMKGDSINARSLNDLNICGLTPEIEEENNNEEYRFKIKPRRGGLGETAIYINGIEIRRYKSLQLKKNGSLYEMVIKKTELNKYFVTGSSNSVVVKAWTSDNSISSRGLTVNVDKSNETKLYPNIFAVMIGVSDYKGDDLDLKYAAKDACDLSRAIKAAAAKLLNNDGKQHVFLYNLTTSEEHYLWPEKNSIKKTLDDIGNKATANDILLIFFAGHGVMHNSRFYFLTADASRSTATDATATVGISTNELAEWIKPANIKAQKRVLIFDACHSGQAINDFVQLGKPGQGYAAARDDENQKANQIKAIEKLNNQSGLFILAASASGKKAYEFGKYSQGLLTYSLLKAIKQQPDILENGKYLDVSNWLNAAKKTVSQLAVDNKERQEPQLNANNNFNIGLVDEEVRNTVTLEGTKPLFSRSNFQNADIKIDNLKLRSAVDNELMTISNRSKNAPIFYSAGYEEQDAYSLTGEYTVLGDSVTVSVLVTKGSTDIVHRFIIRGKANDADNLGIAVVAAAMAWLKEEK